MSDIDMLSTQLFEEAKRFLEKALEESEAAAAREAYAHAALLLAFSSLESHINAVADELTLRPNLHVLDRSILTEKEFALEKGRFIIKDRLKIYRFEDRLSYILANFSSSDPFASGKPSWWPALSAGFNLRNKLVHPKENIQLTAAAVSAAMQAIFECLNALFTAIYNRPFPSFKRGLQSSLNF
ncbi:hypothetical protein SAMN05216567_10123 [Variovorax sp. OK605]|uniref:hypothetical protein n=1 Tax=Variovorax sp. OK605 TaxID=1855317 RepID=UPI0008EC5F96|nr:hypothetical protein [Variovorax sp. OK605]SFO51390.1 hypothetical protein SAMN05216567_10123 [Variovorax sp. OK605]